MKTPIQYAEEIMQVLAEADGSTRGTALDIAKSLHHHKMSAEYVAQLAEQNKEWTQ